MKTINLSEITFENDFYSISMNNGYTIKLNVIDENFLDSSDKEVIFNRINIEVLNEEGVYLASTSSVVGLETPYYTLVTSYKEYEGSILNKDNMKYISIEVKDE